MKAKLEAMTALYEETFAKVQAAEDPEYITFHARRLVEMLGHIIMGYLLIGDASQEPDLFMDSAKVYVNMGEAEVARHARFIGGFNPEDQAAYMRQ
jgi:hypothetical protein